jgi:hypothetical protein
VCRNSVVVIKTNKGLKFRISDPRNERSVGQVRTGPRAYALPWSDYRVFLRDKPDDARRCGYKMVMAEIEKCKQLFPVSNCMEIYRLNQMLRF